LRRAAQRSAWRATENYKRIARPALTPTQVRGDDAVNVLQ